MRRWFYILLLFSLEILFCFNVVASDKVDLRGIQNDWEHYRVVSPDVEFGQYDTEAHKLWLKLYDYGIDAEIARKLGDEAIKWYWGEDVLKHTKYEVCEVAGKDYYVITRKPKLLFGASYQVCISKKDGAILRAEKL